MWSPSSRFRPLNRICGHPPPPGSPVIRIQPTHRTRWSPLLLIGVMSILVVAFGILFGFIWVWMLSKKERAVKRYTEVKKQVELEASTKLITFHGDPPYPISE
ncbi:hypothetical protein RJ641_003932 [Dillenia turbinata]|uniref:Uncharacterized protein n=1 Tax=Dillenia turbinata TaxID=194707 RepID=A0AAN8ZDL5_9MAGN